MYRGFNLRLNRNDLGKYYPIRNAFVENLGFKEDILTDLESYIEASGQLDAKKMQGEWFRNVEADVFISHSRLDKELAEKLACLLYDKYKIKSFIDHFVWGHMDNLLKKIDNAYCKNKGKNSYNYELRNYSTSHIHIMLVTALTKMIDKTECIIFLNTPNSVVGNGIKSKTYSPWIYHEIATTIIIRRRKPKRDFVLLTESENEKKKLEIKYNLNLSNLSVLPIKEFHHWLNFNSGSATEALDELYRLVPPPGLDKKLKKNILLG